ncbi:hypothetical protein HDU80_003051 [Chytriomyces hyalinus]|nr:hypothetical protein HDU80_003051 [Chytriomyces hyalinus]
MFKSKVTGARATELPPIPHVSPITLDKEPANANTGYSSLSSLVSAFLAGATTVALIFFATVTALVMQSDLIVAADKRRLIVAAAVIFVLVLLLSFLHTGYDLYVRYVIRGRRLQSNESVVSA